MKNNLVEKLIPLQVEAYKEILNERNEDNLYGDIIILHDEAIKEEIKNTFRRCEIVTEVNTEQVDIGTVASVVLDGEEMEVVLVQRNNIPTGAKYSFVGMESPLGKALYGKKAGDTFSYMVGNEMIIGAVVALSDQFSADKENEKARAK